MILLPGDPGFEETLSILPFGWCSVANATNGEFAFVARAGNGGLLEAVPWDEVEEYVEGGEWDERLQEIGEDDDEECLETFLI
uniref:Uncharacterized protein n=1 Tax=Oscillatoriales cyanobacterium SpSt-402 TaxID=2282168 RepID=A0A832H5L3_9CYAN